GGEAGLALRDQVAEPRVGVGAGAEAGDLAHRPEPAAVHRRIGPAREGVLPGEADRLVRRIGDVLGRVDPLPRESRDGPVLGAGLGLALDELAQFSSLPHLPHPPDPLDCLAVVHRTPRASADPSHARLIPTPDESWSSAIDVPGVDALYATSVSDPGSRPPAASM